jgi:hypothetical protein
VCPDNLVGRVDAFQTSSYGNEASNNPVLLRSIQPTVALMNNGPGKGGAPQTVARLKSVPGLRDIFQLHLNLRTKPEENTPEELIANLGPREGCAGHGIRLSVAPDARSFTVTNARNGLKRSYPVGRK